MSADTPSTPPAAVRAGDTLKWRRTLACYPATDGWTLRYTLVSSIAAYGFDAAADGDGYAVTVPATTSSAWEPGRYSLTEYVERAGERFTLHVTTLQVQPELAGAAAGLDTRSHAQRVLDAINAYLETGDMVASQVQIADRRIAQIPITELLALHDRYAAEVAREDAAASGGRVGRLLVRF